MAPDTTTGGAANDNRGTATAIRMIDFAKANDADKDRMEKLITAIDNAPHNFDLINNYGQKPLQDYEKVADKVLEAQKRFSDNFATYSGNLKTMREGLDQAKGFMNELGKSLKTLGSATVKGGTKGLGFLRKGLEWFSREKKEKTDEEKEIEGMEESLRVQISVIAKIYQDIAESTPSIKQAHDHAMTLGKSAGDINMELGYYIGAGREMLRRFDEEIIPEQRAILEDPSTSNPIQAGFMYDTLVENRGLLQQRLNVLQESQILGQTTMQQAHQFIQNVRKQQNDISSLRTSGLPNIKNMAANVGNFLMSLKVAGLQQALRTEVESFVDQQLGVLQKTNDILDRIDAQGGGLISTEKLLDVTQRTNQLLEASNEAKRNRQKQLEEQSHQMDELAQGQNAFVRKQRQLEDNAIDAQQEKRAAARKLEEKGVVKEEFKEAASKPVASEQDNAPLPTPDNRASDAAADELRQRRGNKRGGGPTV